MNVNQIVNMILRIFARKGFSMGINKTTSYLARRSPAKPSTPVQSATARDLAKRARQAAKITRRMGR